MALASATRSGTASDRSPGIGPGRQGIETPVTGSAHGERPPTDR